MKNQSDSRPLSALTAEEILEHATWLRSFAGALVRDPNEADDLVQGAFGAAAAAPPDVRDLRGYLAGTVRWLAWKGRRSHARRTDCDTLHAREASRSAPSADEPLEAVEMMRVVLDEIGRLPKTQGRAISLRYIEQLSPDEIARREGTTASTVRSNLTRGLKTLRERLDERNGDRASWCMVLAPWLLSVRGDVLAATVDSPASSVAQGASAPAPAAGATSLSLLAFLMSVKIASAVAVPFVLVAAWFAVQDNGGDALTSPSQGETDVARVDLADVSEVPELDLVAPPAARTVATDVSTPRARSAAPTLHPITGRFVCRETGEGIPDLSVQLKIVDETSRSILERFEATTVADGTFTVADRTLEACSLKVEVIDGGNRRMHRVRDPIRMQFPFEFSLGIKIGPTYRFDYQGISDLTHHRFDVQASGPGIHATRPETTRVRHGINPWVRFASPLADAETPGPWDLRLLSSDGLWVGTCTVDRRVGIEPRVVPVVFESTGGIVFTLDFKTESAPPLSVVHLSSDDGVERITRLEGQEGSQGALFGHVGHLRPGSYRWSLPAGGDIRSGDVQVIAGQTATVAVEVSPAALTARMGILDATAMPGADLSTWECMVFDPGNLKNRFEPHPERAPSLGSDMWSVSLGTVPVSGWMFMVRPTKGYEVDRVGVPIEGANATPTIRVTRSSAPVAVTLMAADAVSGEHLAFAQAKHLDGVNVKSVRCDESGAFEPLDVSASHATTFLVRKGGYQMSEVVFDPGRDATTLRVPLEEGWRSRVAVVDAATMDFLSDVTVHVDGELIGTTGDGGALWIDGNGPPKLIEVARGSETLEVAMSPFESPERGAGDPIRGYMFLVRARK